MTSPPDFDIRYSEVSDLPFLESCFLDRGSCENFPFSFDERVEALKNWMGFAKFKASLTGMIGETPCAVGTLFLMPYRKVAHHCSFYLVVDPRHRRQGIGTSMVRNLLHLAKTRFHLESVNAELYEPSPLFPLLQKIGFVEFARQEGFAKSEEGSFRSRILMEHFFS
jgi:RimJ/RimL family protein N-acetyltransferase